MRGRRADRRSRAKGKHVVIIGGGDTGADCLGTAHRQGAASVTQLDYNPEPPEYRDESRSPWPTWPMVLRTSPCPRCRGRRPALRGRRAAVPRRRARPPAGHRDRRGQGRTRRRRPPHITPGRRRRWKCPATWRCWRSASTGSSTWPLLDGLGLQLNRRGALSCGSDWQTSAPGVFVCGDAHRGASLVVWAIAEGRSAAHAVDTYLMGESDLPEPVEPSSATAGRRLNRFTRLCSADVTSTRQDRLYARPGHRAPTSRAGRWSRRAWTSPGSTSATATTPTTRPTTSASAPHPTPPAARSASWPTCRAPRSGSAGSPPAPRYGQPARPSASPSTTVVGTHDRVSTTYKRLAEDATPATGCWSTTARSALVVEHIDGNDVVCRVTEGGPVSNNKGLSLPGMNVSAPALSEKDIEDLEFALRLGVDFVALSFVRSPADIELVHEVMDRVGPPGARHRQAGEARGHRQPRGDRAGLRRGDGRARRPRRRAAARRGAAGAEARHPNGQGERQTGHRRHPDAGVDDRELPAHPGRGVRRRQRGARRRRRGDAVRRDVGGQVPAGGGEDDGADRLRGRGELGRRPRR